MEEKKQKQQYLVDRIKNPGYDIESFIDFLLSKKGTPSK